MATAIMILSNEGGKEGVITIAASKEAAREVVGIAKRATGSRYVGIETMAAAPLLSEAFGTISRDWETMRRGEPKGFRKHTEKAQN